MATGEEKNKWNGSLNLDEQFSQSELFDIQLTYSGKKPIEQILAQEPVALNTVWQGLPDADNQLIYGDNLAVLAHLAQEQHLHGKIRLIYIDPPFATNKVYKSRSRNDAYHDLLEGAAYLEFLRERLIWLRELLADDGSIYVHLDGNMVFHVKLLMDELFGRDNFRSAITRRKCNPKNYTRKQYGNISDYILFYTKSADYVWHRAYQDWTEERAAKEYQYIEEGTGRRYKKVPIHAPGERNGETGKPWRGKLPPTGKHWQYAPKTLDEMDARGEIYWSPNGNPRRKVYFDESLGIPVQDIWLDVKDAHNQNIKITGYPTEKPLALLRRIIPASSNPGDYVLDCFSGSGTTLHAASELERTWIGVDASLEAIQMTVKRFIHGLEPMGDFVDQPSKETTQKRLPLFEQIATVTDFALRTTPALAQDLERLVYALQDTQPTDTQSDKKGF